MPEAAACASPGDMLPLLGGASDQATISYTLSQPMNADVRVYPPGTIIPTAGSWPLAISTAPVMTFTNVRPGKFKITEYWDGVHNQVMSPDGLYPVVILAYSTAPVAVYDPTSNQMSVVPRYYATDRVVTVLPITRGPVYINDAAVTPTVPTLVNSSDTIKLPPYQIAFTVTRLSSVTINAIDVAGVYCTAPRFIGNICKHIIPGTLYDAGVINKEHWDGTDDYGQTVPIGAYQIQITAYNYPGVTLQQATTFQSNIDVNAFQVFDVGIGDISMKSSSGTIAYQLSLPMKTAVQIFKPGTRINPTTGSPTDAAGNMTLPIKIITGIRPTQTDVRETWDGTDTSLRAGPDGNYIFRIVSSTDSALINWTSGDIYNKDIRYIADTRAYVYPYVITVARGLEVIGDICEYFNENTVFYPNPLRQSRGCFDFGDFVPSQGDYSLHIYNIAGESVFSKTWNSVPVWTQLSLEWNRVNNNGNPVSRGVYFAVLQLKSSSGDKYMPDCPEDSVAG